MEASADRPGEESSSHVKGDVLFSDSDILVYQWIVLAVVCQMIDIFGISANVINIICFMRQGFHDPVNVSLLGLAVSDIGCLSTLIWTNLCLTPAFADADLPFDATEIQYLTSSMPHATFTRVTAWITALITLERCLCITAPLKVKSIITTKRVSVTIVAVYVILISSAAPDYLVTHLGMKFSVNKNKTLVGLIYSDDREQVERFSYLINNVLLPFSAFMVISVCTIVLARKLQVQAKWQKMSTAAETDNVSNRNQKVAKMVVIISTLFIVCFVPVSVVFIAMSLEAEFFISGRYRNSFLAFGGFGLVLESINSSVNIFVYYHMSTRYRTTFCRMFGLSSHKL